MIRFKRANLESKINVTHGSLKYIHFEFCILCRTNYIINWPNQPFEFMLDSLPNFINIVGAWIFIKNFYFISETY